MVASFSEEKIKQELLQPDIVKVSKRGLGTAPVLVPNDTFYNMELVDDLPDDMD